MAAPTTVRLLPDPSQHDLLALTLERVNKASNAARTRALAEGARGRGALRALVKEELDRFKLPNALAAAVVARVETALDRQRFGTYQSLVLPPTAVRWPASDRVTLPTSAGRRTVRVYVDPTRSVGLRPPLEGRPAALVYRNGAFELMDATPRATRE